ncbi:RluA family pseudouridine synthase [Candidatus Peregrinibacteria bacterium]|jgi:23S rRNA pseudouridine1911/1915/1917 synthase|nr:RluA family pseudouridine synthase [Candidatus Peregrinibacteria bacterium]MBT3598263.1 RluA family pseudouridine synthase [Candidatus Peregrinibacteria bacterium]MBT4367546.1 RluA family pseudouridine synthase [Candidatus Peregrinibacteria bacterium]MBT4585521.1 RluA family pseudouridine synthase [Candidatus Peregrinibacteria bacterium]MBT6731336.1 RluA family pseudouridine synthase [Candidatus Peregrinibacteria bacterium]
MTSQWIVSETQRLDAFLADQNDSVSRARIQKAISSGFVEVNGEEVLKIPYKLKEGDQVVLKSQWDERLEETEIIAFDLSIPVIYEDDDCLVIDKLAGYAVHPGSGMAEDEKTILHGVAYLFKERSIPFSSDSVLVHRLDKDTTGCLLIAKTREAHELLQSQFEKRDVNKSYLAIVFGVPNPSKALIDSPIGRNLTDRTKMSVLRTGKSREAKTSYLTLDSTDDTALLQCDIYTGRTHQIRVHLQSIGFPVIGDSSYGSNESNSFSNSMNIKNICLHAWKLSFLSPTKMKVIDLTIPPPDSFVDALNVLKIDRSTI